MYGLTDKERFLSDTARDIYLKSSGYGVTPEQAVMMARQLWDAAMKEAAVGHD